MQITHTINYEGLQMGIVGNYENPEEETGFKGGWSTALIIVNEIDIYWMLNEKTLDRINEIVKLNY